NGSRAGPSPGAVLRRPSETVFRGAPSRGALQPGCRGPFEDELLRLPLEDSTRTFGLRAAPGRRAPSGRHARTGVAAPRAAGAGQTPDEAGAVISRRRRALRRLCHPVRDVLSEASGDTMLRAALIGAGEIALQHLACLRTIPGVTLAGVCDRSR